MGEMDGEQFNTILKQSDFSILNNDYDLIYKDSNNPLLITGSGSLLKDLVILIKKDIILIFIQYL